ncbi:MAG: hypothetical protein A3G24_18225 [Betaproteobacteria bacterium RIFCSPLOWO2_12_FULL_62_13]|nr:MAG: hypothetical protein A3G24_18225 [Betaproteobacteria bacterium RIFCSPLOWO2_12_FULL_62_13]
MVDRSEKRVVVCGGGLAGLTAAVTALESGVPVTLLEKGPELGGNTVLSGGMIWTFAEYDRIRAAIPDGDPVLQWLVHDTIDAARAWLARQGAILGPDQRCHDDIGRGRQMQPPQAIAALADKFTFLGGELRLETALDSLIARNGVIHGVRVARGDRVDEEPARAVVLATGGFQGNPELLSRYVIRDPDNLYLRSNPWSTGDGFLAATQVGALTSRGLDNFYGHALAAPPARFTKLQFRDVSQHYGQQSIAVNLLGERFADESDGNSEDTLNQRLGHQPQGRGFYIIDRELMDCDEPHASGIVTRVIVERAKASGAPVVLADTIEDLCLKLVPFGIPEIRLFREISEFNRLIESGRADELKPARRRHRKSLSRAPFHAVGVKASITFTMGGLQIDERARVVRRTGGSSPSAAMPTTRAFTETDALSIAIGREYRQTAIAGLYAAGCDTGNISHFEYMGGLAPALATGRVAGLSAAGFIKKLFG